MSAKPGTISELFRDVWYPAWDGDDTDHFIEVTRSSWHPDGIHGRHDDPDIPFEDVVELMISEHRTWRPQQHVMLNVVDDGGEWASWQYHWSARYSGDRRNADGSALTEAQRRYEHRAGMFVQWDGERILYGRGFASFSDHEQEMGLEGGDSDHEHGKDGH